MDMGIVLLYKGRQNVQMGGKAKKNCFVSGRPGGQKMFDPGGRKKTFFCTQMEIQMKKENKH